MMVVVKRTKALVSRNVESKSLCDPLKGKVAELLKFILFHHYSLFSIHYSLFTSEAPKYSSVFEYNPVWFE